MLLSDTVDEYSAIAFIILNNETELNNYIELKRKLDFATATKKYDEAYKLLKQIDDEVSVSISGKCYLLKLIQLDKGITASTQIHNQICKENEILSYIANIALKSASIDLPFETELEHCYNAMKADDDVKDFLTAFAFPYKSTKNSRWLRLLLITSLVDLYEGFILQLSNLSPEDLKSDRIRVLINDLASCINDNRIRRFNMFVNPSAINESKYYSEERTIIEDYYSGNYESVKDLAHNYLMTNPMEATILDIYNRSCIKLNSFPEDNLPEDSLYGRVYAMSHIAYANEEYTNICRGQLKNICMSWYSMPQFRHLYHLLKDYNQVNSGSTYIDYWRYSMVPEIRDGAFFETKEELADYLVNAGYNEVNSSQIAIIDERISDIYNQTTNLLYDYDDAKINALIKVIEEDKTAPVVRGVIASRIFARLLAIGRYSEAVSMFVKVKINCNHVTINFNKKQISTVMTDDADGQIDNQLELSVFYTMIGSDVYKRYLAYKRFLRKSGVSRASYLEISDNLLLQYFVSKVCDRSVLSLHVKEFETEDDVDLERIELCKRMSSIGDGKIYAEEITNLMKEQEVKALAQQVNDSKIHVDIQSLINEELSEEKLLYDTYAEIDDNLEIIEKKNIEGLLEFINRKYDGKNVFVAYDSPAVKYKKVLFIQLFKSIRDKFLFDPKYGLDKYLSARIRHGTLITQLRNHFLSHDLVTNKKDGGEYSRESAWTSRRGTRLSTERKTKVNNRLLQFTEWFDSSLLYVKDERIQILTERNNAKPDGLFNYSEELLTKIIEDLWRRSFESFEIFTNSVINELWEWTGKVLTDVRDFFIDYQNKVLNEMTILQNDILDCLIEYPTLSNSFKDALTTCRTEFQSDISMVSSWFKLEQSRVKFFTIRQAVDTSLSVINKINLIPLTFSEINISENGIFNGMYFNAFHDIFHDMMNNILAYEIKRPYLKGKASIQINTVNNVLFVEVCNPIDSQDEEEISKILIEQQNFPILIAGGKTRKEINSGCAKIYSTVMYTLGANNKYLNSIDNGSFVTRIQIDTNKLRYNENTTG